MNAQQITQCIDFLEKRLKLTNQLQNRIKLYARILELKNELINRK